ncbi:hypothetical protein Tco_0911657 [Tanacetum coccineum]|uniref:Uncharacterized protein n=1 Tax=Tanacetum coccineum TaxID=301880 RepID=A0ABQ5CZ41_9ASTR
MISKDAEPPKGSKSKESKSSSFKGTKPWPKSSGKSTQADEPVFEAADIKMQQDQGKCYKAITNRLDWNNPEGHEYPFDLSKPPPLIEVQGRQVVPADYFFNNDLEYLKGASSSRKYTTSTTKTKAVKYDNIKGIEDMVPKLWSLVKVAYDQYAMWVTHVKVMKLGSSGKSKRRDCSVAMTVLVPSLLTSSLERFNTSAGNPVKEILLKLNLPDHRSILTDSKEYIKMDVEVPGSSRLTDS